MAKSTKSRSDKGGERWRPQGGCLRAWLTDHARVASDTTLFVSQRMLSSLLVWLMVGVALTLPGLLWIAQSNLQTFSQQWQGNAGLTVYMKLTASDAAVADMAERLRQRVNIARIEVTTPEQALQQMLAQSGDSEFLRQALVAVETNPLPASFAVVPDSGASFLALEAVRRQLLAESGVDDVVIETTWLERLRDLSDLVSRVGAGLSIMLLLAAVMVAFASVRIAIESRLGELRVLELIGATPAQMRRPFLYFGSAYGLGGGFVAIILIAVFLDQIEAPLLSLAVSYQVGFQIAGFTPAFLLVMLLLGWVLGVLGALLALSQRSPLA